MLTKHTPEALAAIEAAYRRGYAQAAHCAARDAAEGYDLLAWAKEVDAWRHAARFGPKKYAPPMTPPPEPWEIQTKKQKGATC